MSRTIPLFVLLATNLLIACAQQAPIRVPTSEEETDLKAVYERACLGPDAGHAGHIVKRLVLLNGLVVVFRCSYPQSREFSYHITRLENHKWSLPISLDESLVLYGSGAWIDEVTNVSKKGNAVVVSALVHTESDSYCCPGSETEISIYPENFSLGKAPTNVAVWPRNER